MCPGPGGVEDFEHFGGFVEQRVLAGKGSVHSACNVEPLFARFGREVAERADGFLARAFGGGDRLHQQIAGVGFVFVLAGALTQIHCATMVAPRLRSYNIFHLNRLVTILASFDGMFTRIVDESSTYTHAATRPRPKSARMRGVTVEVGLASTVKEQERRNHDYDGENKDDEAQRRCAGSKGHGHLREHPHGRGCIDARRVERYRKIDPRQQEREQAATEDTWSK